MKKWLILLGMAVTMSAFLVLLTACTEEAPKESDFYTYVRSKHDGNVKGGNEVWLGIDIDTQRTNVEEQNSGYALKIYYRDGVLKSMTSISRIFYSKLGLYVQETTDVQAEEILRALEGTNVFWRDVNDMDMLWCEKTIDGTLYTMRIYFYKDRTIKGINVCTDVTLEDFGNKPGW